MSRDIGLREKLRALREGRLGLDDLYSLLDELDESDSTHAERDVAELLRHTNPIVRYTAIQVLAFTWETRLYRDKLEAMLLHDLDTDVRHTAASALGWLLRGSQDAKATKLLLSSLRSEDESAIVREVAYGALLDIWLQPAGRERTTANVLRFADRILRYAERSSALVRELDEALRAGNTAKEEAIRDALSRPDDSWKERVDWDAVAAIERGEAPKPRALG